MRFWIVPMFLLGCGAGANPVADANGTADANGAADGGVGGDASTDIGPEHPTYDEHVAPLLEASCVGCHRPSTVPEARNCVRLDRWGSVADTDMLCSDASTGGLIFGVRDGGPMIVELVTEGVMPLGGPPLPDAQIQLLQRWRDDGFPKHAVNGAPTIVITEPPAGGAVLCDPSCLYEVAYDVGDPDRDEVTWSLGWAGVGGAGSFVTDLAGGTGTVTIDATSLVTGSYTLTARLDDGATVVAVDAIGSFTVAADHNAEPTVTVESPNGGESYYATEPLTVTWTGNDADHPSLTYDVVALQGTTEILIKAGIVAPVGEVVSTIWTPPAVSGLTAYRIQVTARDDGSPPQSAVDTSDATFSVSPPPVVVSFANQIQPILTASCTGAACHDAAAPVRGLNLTAGAAYTELLTSRSLVTACASFRLVVPDQPDQSYLIFKLQGSGACYAGGRMPRGQPALPAAQLQLFRDWIANGAPNN